MEKSADGRQALRSVNMHVAGSGQRARVGSRSRFERMEENWKGKGVATENQPVCLLD